MINIVLAICIFSMMLVIMKLFKKYGVDNQQAIVVNYIAASILGFALSDRKDSLHSVVHADWLIYAAGVGVLFIITFNLLAHATQTVGLAVATVSNKMSVVIPIVAAVILYDEGVSVARIVGICLALAGIYLTSTNNGKLSFDPKYLWVVGLIFVGQGIADMIFNHARVMHVSDPDRMLFFTMIFFFAAVLGLIFTFAKLTKGPPNFKFKNVFWGIALGIPNYFALEFFFKSLNSKTLESSQVYPLINMGIVLLGSLLGLLLFREKLSRINWIGIGIAVAAIALLSM